MKILALDVASKTGWCNDTASGVWDLRPKRDESKGIRLVRFKAKLNELIKLERPDIVVFERSSGFHQNAVIVQSEFHGVLKVTLEEHELEYRAYSAGEIKKHATGKGNANKEMMVKAYIERVGSEPVDDNHADAFFLHDLAKGDLL